MNRQCPVCELHYPPSGFYLNGAGKPNKCCRSCQRIRQANRDKQQRQSRYAVQESGFSEVAQRFNMLRWFTNTGG